MAEPSRPAGSRRERREGWPRWLKVLVIIGILVVVLVIVMLVLGGGGGGGGHRPRFDHGMGWTA